MLDTYFSRSGIYNWTFLYETDKQGDEMTCFGISSEQIPSSTSYEKCADFCMVRAYNGYLYQNGEKLKGQYHSFHPGSLVKFQLDLYENTLSIAINEEPYEIIFKNVKGNVYPAICFYEKNRSVVLKEISSQIVDVDNSPPGRETIPMESFSYLENPVNNKI